MSVASATDRFTTNTSLSAAFNNIGKEAHWAEEVEIGESARKVSLVALLAGSSAVLIAVVVAISLTPMATLWMNSVNDLSGTAESSSLEQINRYRSLIVEKATTNVTDKLNQPVRAVRLLEGQLPASFFAGNLSDVVAYAHSVVPSIDAMYPGVNAILVPWTNQYGVHEFETKWSSNRSYSLLESSNASGGTQMTFYKYDPDTVQPTGVPTGEIIAVYNPTWRAWYSDGMSATKTVNGIAWTNPTISKLPSEGMLVFCTLNVSKAGMPAGSTSVLAITMAIGSLIEFFGKMQLTANGRVFLMTSDLGLIAGSNGLLTVNTTAQAAINATRSPDPDVRSAVAEWLSHTGGVKESAHFLYTEPDEGDQKYVDVERIEVEGLVWWLVLLTPPSDFMADILDANSRAKGSALQTLGIVVGVEVFVMVAVLAMAVSLAWRLGRSLTKVTAQLQNITDMQFSARRANSIGSGIREIFQLEVKTAKMSVAMQSFGKYVPKKVVRFIVDNNLEASVGIRKAKATVFFLDIVDFTKSMQQYGVSIIIGVLNDLFEEFSSILVTHGANIDKYIGDSIMATWGCPEKVDKAEIRACEAVHEIIEALNKKNEQFLKENGFKVGIRIGFHSGPVYAGNVGSSSRLNYTVLGDTVNLAARLEPLNKEIGTHFCTTDSVRNAAEGTFAFRALLNINVRGFAAPLLVHEFVGKNDLLTHEQLSMLEDYKNIDSKLRAGEKVEAYELEEYEKLHPEDPAIPFILKKKLAEAQDNAEASRTNGNA